MPNAGPSPQPVKPCAVQNPVLHSVAVRVRWHDTREDVAAVKCRFVLGATVVHPGPLANGAMDKAALAAGNYEVTLPEVDADEWAEE